MYLILQAVTSLAQGNLGIVLSIIIFKSVFVQNTFQLFWSMVVALGSGHGRNLQQSEQQKCEGQNRRKPNTM